MVARPGLLSSEQLDAITSSALRLVDEIGMETNRVDLLERARGLSGLTVRGNRIHVAPQVVNEVVERARAARLTVRKNRVVVAPPAVDSIRPERPTIDVSDRSTWFADHSCRKLRPLTWADVVTGTKLLDALSSRCVEGHASGTPQGTLAPLRPIEQYLIGFRYSRHGAGVPLLPGHEADRFLFEMREIAEDGFDAMERDFSVWVPSPLKLEGNELDDMLDSGARVRSFFVGSMPIMGLTGPVDPVGISTLALAETMGGTAILHRLFPQAQVTLRPHPEPMDPQTGIMALGTPEWIQLELLQKGILESLGLPSYRMDVLTSACMPDLQAQSDKMSALAFGVAHGFSCFNLFPLSASEVWSHAQVVLDVEYVHRAWKTHALSAGVRRAADALETTSLSVQEGGIVGAMADTVRHLRETYYRSPLRRAFSPAQWIEAGRPDPLADAEAYARELVAKADYAPPADKLRNLIEVYHRACREYSTEPMELD